MSFSLEEVLELVDKDRAKHLADFAQKDAEWSRKLQDIELLNHKLYSILDTIHKLVVKNARAQGWLIDFLAVESIQDPKLRQEVKDFLNDRKL